jgi:Cu/Ag efflux pump CusA
VLDTTGPNILMRENVQRRMVVFCNVQDRDLAGVVADIRAALADVESRLRNMSGSYRIEYGGQFEAQQQANVRILILGSLSVVGVFLLLCKCLQSWRAAVQVLVNIPLAALGSVVALLLVNWPNQDALMIAHYIHLMQHEGETFGEKMIVRGTLERLAPVMMTAFSSFIGLLPLLFGAGQTGKEILYPLALVVFGGMVSSTLLDQLVTPALFHKFGRKVYDATLTPETTVPDPAS